LRSKENKGALARLIVLRLKSYRVSPAKKMTSIRGVMEFRLPVPVREALATPRRAP
jgi:hypothetical protein